MNIEGLAPTAGLVATGFSGHPRGAALIPVLMVVLLTAAVTAVALFGQQWIVAQAARAVPGEGFYWSVAQYQIAHQRLKQELRAVAAGEPADPQVIAQRWAVLASRASILGEPSAVNTLLRDVKGFEEASGRINEMHRRLAPLLDPVQSLSRTEAQQVLLTFKNADDETLLSQLANDARQTELAAKEMMVASLGRRLSWVWVGFGLCWAVLALWLLSAARSARRYAQAAAERQQALDAMTQAINSQRSFLRMVNHELRSPLQSIVTAAESLAQDIALGQSRPRSAVAVGRIRRATSGLQALLRDLLTIARSDTDGPGLQQETFECSSLVRDVCADYEDAALAKNLSLGVTLPDRPQTVHADPIRIAQVLRNLLDNAIRHTDVGRVDVQLHAERDPASASEGHAMRFTVTDTGPGMPAGALARLRSSDAAAEARDEAPEQNMRIGLLVIGAVLRQLGGRIEVSSAVGQGTQVHVHIPVQALADEKRALEIPGTDVLRILVVDDRIEVLDALSAAALELGHRCDVALSAQAAMPLLAHTRYDTVLIDLDMPGTSGLELARAIRDTRSTELLLNAHAMLILISAPDNREVGLQPPFDGFLAKPVSAQALSALIGSRRTH